MSLWDNRIVGEGMEAPDQILANPMNWRKHPLHQKKALRGVLKEVGWVQRTIINQRTGHLIDGHLRVELAMEDGETEVPVVYVDLSEEEEKIALASLDSISALAETDQEMIDQVVQAINVQDQDLTEFLNSLTSDFEIDPETEGEADPDAAPDPQPFAISKPGDMWILGEHRVHCNDSTSIAAVEALCQGEPIDMVWTDPPYNVNYESSSGMKIENDHMSDDKFRNFLRDIFIAAFTVTREGGPIYVAHADSEGMNFRAALLESGFLFKQCLVWVKNSMVLGRQDYQWQHEPILYGWKPGAAHKWYGEFNKKTVIDDEPRVQDMDKTDLLAEVRRLRNALQTSIIREDKPKRNGDHPTMKPVALIVHMLKNSSARGDRVLDLCGGSGSTMIAAERLGRASRLMELDPIYCDVIVKRYQEYTGQPGILESTGETFNSIGVDS
jgi:DNA modification methylase